MIFLKNFIHHLVSIFKNLPINMLAESKEQAQGILLDWGTHTFKNYDNPFTLVTHLHMMLVFL